MRHLARAGSAVLAFALASGLAAPSPARAFKAGGDFAKPAAAGGGSRITFTGAPAYKKWTCVICHQDAPGKIKIGLELDGDALATRRYEPGRTYQVKVKLIGEHAGLSSALNTNGMALTVVAGASQPGGQLSGYDGSLLRQGNDDNEIVSTGLVDKQTEWTFTWTAPPTGTGSVTFYLAVVDGDGAARTDRRTSDPFHDDVATGFIVFEERPGP